MTPIFKPTWHTICIVYPCRSVYSGRYCFLDALVETKSITPVEYALQDKWFELMTRELDSHIKPDLISKDKRVVRDHDLELFFPSSLLEM